jgi:hypothetical protein
LRRKAGESAGRVFSVVAGLYEGIVSKTKTRRFDVAEHLRTPEEMAAYLEACLKEADGDTAFIAKAVDDIGRAKAWHREWSDAVNFCVQ